MGPDNVRKMRAKNKTVKRNGLLDVFKSSSKPSAKSIREREEHDEQIKYLTERLTDICKHNSASGDLKKPSYMTIKQMLYSAYNRSGQTVTVTDDEVKSLIDHVWDKNKPTRNPRSGSDADSKDAARLSSAFVGHKLTPFISGPGEQWISGCSICGKTAIVASGKLGGEAISSTCTSGRAK